MGAGLSFANPVKQNHLPNWWGAFSHNLKENAEGSSVSGWLSPVCEGTEGVRTHLSEGERERKSGFEL